MSEELNAMRAEECFEELYGVDGDGLGEGEGSCEADFEQVGLELEQNPGHRERHTAEGGEMSCRPASEGPGADLQREVGPTRAQASRIEG
jgi:hypothetical protein